MAGTLRSEVWMSAIGACGLLKSTVMEYENCTSERSSRTYLGIEVAWHDWMEVISIEGIGDREIPSTRSVDLDCRRENKVGKRLFNCPVPVRHSK